MTTPEQPHDGDTVFSTSPWDALSQQQATNTSHNTGCQGTDGFTYQSAANPVEQGNTATVTLTVQPTVPTANNDHGTGYYEHNADDLSPGGSSGSNESGGKGVL